MCFLTWKETLGGTLGKVCDWEMIGDNMVKTGRGLVLTSQMTNWRTGRL